MNVVPGAIIESHLHSRFIYMHSHLSSSQYTWVETHPTTTAISSSPTKRAFVPMIVMPPASIYEYLISTWILCARKIHNLRVGRAWQSFVFIMLLETVQYRSQTQMQNDGQKQADYILGCSRFLKNVCLKHQIPETLLLWVLRETIRSDFKLILLEQVPAHNIESASHLVFIKLYVWVLRYICSQDWSIF